MHAMFSLLLLASMAQAPRADTTRMLASDDSTVVDASSTRQPTAVISLVSPAPVLARRARAESAASSPVAHASRAPQGRPKAIEYSEWYGRRAKIHRISSYAMLPLFATEYWLGDKLLNDRDVASWVKPMHQTVASGIFTLFGVNTVTGLWNAWDARHDAADRTRRTVHAALMLAADAGFLWTVSLAEDSNGGGGGGGGLESRGDDHRTAALVSIGVSSLGAALMILWPK